ncbi:hypothetical protein [Cellulomonas gilvus]|uniref:Putative lipoprotein n=1 Tax=Cellulomonas gilvus (strain ATCC 13127 / NRRL B-14078) TaxID=593907 RepID=F8A1R7_CELGA|nr:hypothetical protein [Cellulomonas gilvus]AEI11724.1 putative lipoprotein [Cellulomonas gilvus ATCC 13127]
MTGALVVALGVGLAVVAADENAPRDAATGATSTRPGSARAPRPSDATTVPAAPGASSDPAAPRRAAPDDAATVLPARDGVSAAVQASRAVFAASPVVVLAAHDDQAAQLTGASAAVALGVPLLLTDDSGAAATEVTRLGAHAVLAVGDLGPTGLPDDVVVARVAARAGAGELRAVTGIPFGPRVAVAPGAHAKAVRALGADPVPVLVPRGSGAAPAPTGTADVLPRVVRAPRLPGVVAATGVGVEPVAALATVRAASVPVLDLPGGDPRTSAASVRAVARTAPQHVIAIGTRFGPADVLARRVATAATGVQAPGGGQLVFPSGEGVARKRYVALYGTPGSAALGLLGEQDVPATIERARAFAANYARRTHDTVVPAVEAIATIASAGPGPDGDYSRERSVAELRPLVEAAGEAGALVVLDLQPGRTDFLTQAKRYTELLELPHVGLALDPEWRLRPDQVHLEQIGSVRVDEVDAVGDWLADLTARNHLPQKMFVLHQFASSMISGRGLLDVSHDELAVVVHVDGQGTQRAKRGTWRTLRADAPDVHWGWKNFVDEDRPMLTVEQTLRVRPVPDLITYQ